MEKTHQLTPEQAWEPEMPMIWLVRDTKAFGLDGRTSPDDRSVEFRLTYQEWLAIFLDALGVDKDGYEKWAAKRVVIGQPGVVTLLTKIDEEVPEYPMLSRMRGPYHDVAFERDELEDLHKECLRAKALTSNRLALQGLDKLIHVYDQAKELGLSIYFVSN